MRSSALVCATVGALALTGIATTAPAQARHFGPAFAGGLIAGALVAGAASSAYAYAPGPGYAYDDGPAYTYGYASAPGYYIPRREHPYRTYGVYDESQHGGQPSYTSPTGD
ncbi:hypothetical protein [Bradyrhizobium guangdongense]|uniref:BA14K family protein n=1 Tax=Bradyrhizobium guangdongense TaxID=1325090 RepID=A0AA87WC39_9BRAD|nr:hypothetical protein [Bradyrhizobium guangdongense]GGI34305.1 hypothetical protein GCM10010987_78730 [Bradyrhizobium guangdongense]